MPNPFISQSERVIRDAAVVRSRQLWPNGRIIHELNIDQGEARADLAVVTPSRLILIEIKSERDKLHRLGHQLRHFGPVSHAVIVAAHQRWCIGSKLPNECVRTIIDYAGAGHLWRHPQVASWVAPAQWSVPWHWRMLTLLWLDELRAIAARLNLQRVQSSTAGEMARSLALQMAGRDAEAAVCQALRQRKFNEADPPIEVAA